MVKILTIFDCFKNFRLLDYGHAKYQFNLMSSGDVKHINFQANFKFPDFMGNSTFRQNHKIITITRSKSPDNVLQI